MRRLLLCIVMLVVLTYTAFAQVDPAAVPVVAVEWNETGVIVPLAEVPELTLVSHQILQGEPGAHSYNFIVEDQWPRQMKWECSMPESTPAIPVKMELILELTGLPLVNPPGRWWVKMKIQIALELYGSMGPPSELSDLVYVIDWVDKKTGKPRRVE